MLKRLRRFVGDRRNAIRRPAQRKARLVFSLTLEGEDARARTMPVEGYTRDISESGVAIIVPSLRVADTYLTASNCKLRIVLLNLPNGEVEIEATPVRHEDLGEGRGHLIGARITGMSSDDRARLVEFLSTLSS
jgi:hypothetical protein